jgi:predicted amidohydrolase
MVGCEEVGTPLNTIRVAAVSMNGFLGDPERALRNVGEWCARAADEGAGLVLFPELVIHGHCSPNTPALAEPVPDGPSTQALTALAHRHHLFVCAGLAEKDRGAVYDTQVLVGPAGYCGSQRKLHMSRDESRYYAGGADFGVFDLGACKVGIGICYDNEFPEVPRILALRGAEILLMPHASRDRMWDDTPESEAAARRYIHDHHLPFAMRAKENACYVVLADQAGRAGYVDDLARDHPNQPHHAGAALVFAPDGSLIASTQRDRIQDEMIVVTLDGAALERERAHPNYQLRTRRPELFGELAQVPVQRPGLSRVGGIS